jgi:hypothetical protein
MSQSLEFGCAPFGAPGPHDADVSLVETLLDRFRYHHRLVVDAPPGAMVVLPRHCPECGQPIRYARIVRTLWQLRGTELPAAADITVFGQEPPEGPAVGPR